VKTLGLTVAFVVALGMAAFLAGWGIFADYLGSPASASRQDATVIEIPGNLGSEALAKLLSEKGLVQRPQWFVAYLDQFHRSPQITGGEYALSPNMSPAEIVDRLSRGLVVTYPITVAPGARARDVVKNLAEAKLANETELLGMLKDPDVPARLEIPGTSIEGYLFPDAYVFSRGLSATAILGKMVQRYRQAISPELLDAARQRGLVEHQLVTLASMIQASPVPAREWAQLSAVYHNRLRAAMPLEDLGSLAYGLEKRPTEITESDREADSPYNTFANTGLPPSPIGSPALEAITAAANPAKIDARHYAAKGDGTHIFCDDEECLRIALQQAGLPPPPPPPRPKRPTQR
jgi:UPF0755 protein